jgi:myo-inositol-1(or 4)-monophosphatase
VEELNGENLNLLEDIAREVYSVVHPLLGIPEAGRIVGAGFGGDETRVIDEVAEQAIIQCLKRNRQSCIFIGEESGVRKIGDEPQFYLISDAVDGSTNAVRGIGFISSSLAISPTDCLEDVEAAVVMNLVNGGLYEAKRGKGAWYNGTAIKPSQTSVLEEGVIGIDVSRAPEKVENIISLMKIVKSVRSLGSAALEICYVASGILDAYVDLRSKLRTLDFAAGMLIVKEAGGVFLQPDGGDFNVSLTEVNRFSVIAAANKKLYKAIVNLFKP